MNLSVRKSGQMGAKMTNTDFDFKRIAEGYKNRPFLHRQVIEKFQSDTGKTSFALGLDIGCGAGLSTKALKNICEKAIGTDISPEMIRVAKEVCSQDTNIEYFVGSAEDLTIGEGKADIATAAGAIQWIDRERFLLNMKRIIKEKGYLLIYDFAISDVMMGNPAYTAWWHDRYVKEFPKPYRNENVWKEEDVIPYGFIMTEQVELNMEYDFDMETFIDFMMIQSNVNAKIDKEGRKEEEVYDWFRETLFPIFQEREQRLVFKGYSWYLLRKAMN